MTPDRVVVVGIPVFNGAKTIRETLLNVLRQSHRDLRVVVYDDGSKDRTPDIVDRLRKNHPRIELHREETNRGRGYARARIVEIAGDHLLAWQDADDLWHPEKIDIERRAWIAAQGEEGDVMVVSPFRLDQSADGAPAKRHIKMPPDDFTLAHIFSASYRQYHFQLQATFAHARSYRRAGNFDPNLNWAEDLDMALKLLRSGIRIVGNRHPEPLAYYNQTLGSGSGRLAEECQQIVRARHRDFVSAAGFDMDRILAIRAASYIGQMYETRGQHQQALAVNLKAMARLDPDAESFDEDVMGIARNLLGIVRAIGRQDGTTAPAVPTAAEASDDDEPEPFRPRQFGSASSPITPAVGVRRLLLHIGGEKTGTTSLQATLAANRHRLIQAGVLYPESLGRMNHVAAYVMASRGDVDEIKGQLDVVTPDEATAFRERILRSLAAELQDRTPRTVVISNEHLSSRLTSRAETRGIVDDLRRLCPQAEIDVLYVARSQRDLVTSCYSTYVKTGGTERLRYPLTISAILAVLDHAAILERWQHAGADRVRVTPYARPDGTPRDVVALVGRDLGVGLSVEEVRNPALPAKALEALRLVNDYLPRTRDHRFNPDRGNIAEILEGFEGPPLTLPEDLARRIDTDYAPSNRAFNAAAGNAVMAATVWDLPEAPDPVDLNPTLEASEVAEILGYVFSQKHGQVQTLRTALRRRHAPA